MADAVIMSALIAHELQNCRTRANLDPTHVICVIQTQRAASHIYFCAYLSLTALAFNLDFVVDLKLERE